MVLRHVAKIIVAFGEAVGKAFTRAVREEYVASKNAAQNQSSSTNNTTSSRDAIKVNSKLGISLQESLQILDLKQPIDCEELEKRYKHLFEVNEKANGSTLYLQSKIYRAKERIDAELKRLSSINEKKGSKKEDPKT